MKKINLEEVKSVHDRARISILTINELLDELAKQNIINLDDESNDNLIYNKNDDIIEEKEK